MKQNSVMRRGFTAVKKTTRKLVKEAKLQATDLQANAKVQAAALKEKHAPALSELKSRMTAMVEGTSNTSRIRVKRSGSIVHLIHMHTFIQAI